MNNESSMSGLHNSSHLRALQRVQHVHACTTGGTQRVAVREVGVKERARRAAWVQQEGDSRPQDQLVQLGTSVQAGSAKESGRR